MHRFSATTLVVVIVASLLVPLAISQAYHQVDLSGFETIRRDSKPILLESVQFTPPIDTTATVPEYPMISRALMLDGGSTDVVLGDVTKDGIDDLVVAVAGEYSRISVFEGQPSDVFPTYASYDISLSRVPISLAILDARGIEEHQIAVLENRLTDLEVDRLEIFDFNITTSSFDAFLNEPRYIPYANATMLVAGNLSGDGSDDVAVVCGGGSPLTQPGYVLLFQGPSYMSPDVFRTGLGSYAVCTSDFNADGDIDLAVSNSHDSTVMIFHQPFSWDMSPDVTVDIDGTPVCLTGGELNAVGSDDLVVVTSNPSAVRFFMQNLGSIPTSEDYSRSLSYVPSSVKVGDMDDDGRDDLLILSEDESVVLGMLQRSTSPIWRSIPDFVFPTGEMPRGSLIADLDGNAETDIAVASAPIDLNGSSIALYLSNSPSFSNSNLTMWTGYSPSRVSVGDLNGDDSDDAVILFPENDAFGYSTSFSSSMTLMALGYEPRVLLVMDINSDGYDDVLTTAKNGADFTVHLGAPTLPSGFNSHQYSCSHNITFACSGDLNGDGLQDLVFSTDGGEIEVFFNTGTEDPFDSQVILPVSPGTSIGSVTVGDFDSDGLDDLAFPKGIRTIGIVLQDPYAPSPISLPSDLNLTASFDDVFGLVLSGDITGDGRDDILGMRSGSDKLFLYDQADFAGTVPFGTLNLPESPAFVDLFDATDDGCDDLLALFDSADLAFLYRQEGGVLPSSPSMTFVTGASPCSVTLGDATQDHRGDLIVCNAASRCLSAWEQLNFPPVADAGGPYTAYQGDPFTFDGSSVTGSSEVPYMEYRWDFDGDDEWDTGWVREPNAVHTYMSLGDFDVTMEVRDPLGLNDTDYTTVTVVDSYPHASFTIEPYPPSEGITVYFNDTTTSYDDVVLMNWSIDGALVSSGLVSSIEAVFDDGLHEVSLEVTDSDGSVDNRTETFDVLRSAPEIAISAPSVVDEGSVVTFLVLIDSSLGGPWDPIASCEWNFSYDGEPFIADETTYTNTTTHVFYSDGVSEVYSVAVKVTDTDGSSAIAVFNITVMDIGPDASLTLSTPIPGEGQPFTFLASESPDGVISWSWVLTGPAGPIGAYDATAEEMSEMEFVLGDGAYGMSLVVVEADGDSDSSELNFTVAELPPEVSLTPIPAQTSYPEFESLTLSVYVESYDDVILYEWDFIASGGEFLPDSSTEVNSTEHSYLWAGNYTAKVRVTDSDGSSSIDFITIEIQDRELDGTFDDILVSRGAPPSTSTLTFNATFFAYEYPDISNVLWEFGDGAELLRTGPPTTPVVHVYDPVSNYEVRVTMTDDDGNVLVLNRSLPLVEPVIGLQSPSDGSVVVPGTSIRFSVSDDTIPLEYVRYSLDGGPLLDFTTLYELDTSSWPDGHHSISVMAGDRDGNVAILDGIDIVIDSISPVVVLQANPTEVYAGDRLNITVLVDDENTDVGSVFLQIEFPGDDSPLRVSMKPSEGGLFYAVVEVPMRTGTITYWFEAEDLAGNTAESESTYTIEVKMHFIDAYWPYLLALAIAAAFGTAAYFVRESKIAVDETFVIYNDGRLMAHSTRRLKPGMDDQVLGSMLVAVQDFVRDSFKDETSFTLRKLDFGGKSVLLERGESIFLAAVLHGKVSKKVTRRMKSVLNEIEGEFSLELLDWDGDLDKVRGVNDIMKKLYSRAPEFPGNLE